MISLFQPDHRRIPARRPRLSPAPGRNAGRCAPSVRLENLGADPDRGVARIAHDHDVGDVDRGFLLHDAAGLLRAARLGMALDQVHPFDEHTLLLGQHLDDLAGLAALLPATTITLSSLRTKRLIAPPAPGKRSS